MPVDAVAALVPSVGVGLLFWLVLRSMLQADRRERAAVARLEKAEKKDAEKPGK